MVTPVDVIREVYAGFDRGSINELLTSLHPQAEWHEAEHVTFWPGSPFVGPDAVIRGLFARIPKVFGDTWSIDVERLFGSATTVIMQGRYSGIVQSTGEHLSPQVAHIWDFEDGKIVRFQQYTDTWLFAQATGITPVSG